jgi:MinD-like ATPase involved in chromosome partitioning or flagellar assembly
VRGDVHGWVFLPLFEEPEASRSLELLASRLSPSPPVPVTCLKPPLGGLAFMAAEGEVSDMLDAWWASAVPEDRTPVLLLRHEPGLERWLGKVDAEVVVGVAGEEELEWYRAMPHVRAVVTREVEALTEVAMRAHPDCFEPGGAPPSEAEETPYRPRAAGQVLRGRLRPPSVVAPGPELPALAEDPAGGPEAVAGPPEEVPRGPAPGLPTGRPSPPPAVPMPGSDGSRAGPLLRGLVERAAGLLNPALRPNWVPAELTGLALAHTTGKIVGVSSRAGGVGKTAIAAALGIVYGEAVQGSGWSAAVVDQNIGNPDQWGRLTLTAEVPTVFEVMADIEAGREWSVPAWNRTPALAVYPERRDLGDAYAPGQIERFAAQLRQLHVLSVIDLPNRLPAFTSAEAAVCAGWLAVCDLLLIPTTDDPTRLQGVLDYLDAPMVRGDAAGGGLGVVVPYIRSRLREVREDAGVRALLDRIRARVVAVVEIPSNERATLAIVQGKPITEVDAGLRNAYLELALTVARALSQR